jgi:hypothetical protein
VEYFSNFFGDVGKYVRIMGEVEECPCQSYCSCVGATLYGGEVSITF